MAFITTMQAAKILGVSDRRVRQYVEEKRLKAQELGGMYLVREADLKKITKRKRGPKPKRRKAVAEIPSDSGK